MKKTISFLIVSIIMLAIAKPVFSVSTSKSVISADTMTLTLAPATIGSSNIISFNLSSIPDGAVVSKIVVDASAKIVSTGQGPIVSEKLYVKNQRMNSWASAVWGSLNKTEISAGLVGKSASGTWYVYYTGENISNLFSGSKSYKNVKLTVYYIY